MRGAASAERSVEHRWGQRVELEMPLRLILGSFEPVTAQLCNLSVSGALVQTAQPLPLWARLDVELDLPRQSRRLERVAAHVTRRTKDGVGIAWSELAPHMVRVLLNGAQSRTAGASPPNVRYPSPSRSAADPDADCATEPAAHSDPRQAHG